MIRGGLGTSCMPSRPCVQHDPCIRCQAQRVLDADDWYLIDFYRRAASQVVLVGQHVLLRMEGVKAALEVGGYPRELHGWLADGVQMLHGLVSEQDHVDWQTELGKSRRDVRPEDVT